MPFAGSLRPRYCQKSKLKEYVAEKRILLLINELTDELLKTMPKDPRAHLTAYLQQGTIPKERKAQRCTGDLLKEELRSAWLGCGGNLELFKQALPAEVKTKWEGHVALQVPRARSVTKSKFEAPPETESGVDPLMRPVQLVPDGYQPPCDIFQIVSDLSTWHFPSRKLWPQTAIARIEQNCRNIGQRHNYGEPLEVAIPLYIYSITVYRDVVWAVWTVTGSDEHARWSLTTRDSFTSLEAFFKKNDQTLPADATKYATSPMQAVVARQGLTLFEEVKPCCLKSVVYLSRYEMKATEVNNEASPLADTVAWLPPPCCILNKTLTLPPPGVLEYLYSRRSIEETSMYEDTADSFRSEPLFKKNPIFATLERCLRKNGERDLTKTIHNQLKELALHEGYANDVVDLISECFDDDDDDDSEECSTREQLRTLLEKEECNLQVTNLIEDCLDQHNQQEYSQDIYERLVVLLRSNRKIERVKKLIEMKLGPKTKNTPTPLQIAHSLDINTITWGGRTLNAALSGSCFYIDGDRDVFPDPIRLFRVDHPYEEQPYYHLNATMRCLQENKTATTFEMSSASANEYSIVDDVFVARPDTVLGTGLKCLSKVAKTPKARTCLTKLLEHKWQCSLDSTTRSVHYHFDHKYNHAKSADQYFDTTTHEGVGWYLLPDNVKVTGSFTSGAWLYQQVKPLLYYVDSAMKNMSRTIASTGWVCAPPEGERAKCYRGLKGTKLNRNVYDRGNVVVWSSFSSTSSDQGIAYSYAAGGNASVFIIRGKACRLIAPWSRFGREEEWLYPLNTRFQVQSLLTEEQKKILGRSDLQVFEISEVDETGAELIKVRGCLAKADTKEAMGVVFAASTALEDGNGVLDLALNDQNDGVTQAKWIYTIAVSFDPQGHCPIFTSDITKVCCPTTAKELLNKTGFMTEKKTKMILEPDTDVNLQEPEAGLANKPNRLAQSNMARPTRHRRARRAFFSGSIVECSLCGVKIKERHSEQHRKRCVQPGQAFYNNSTEEGKMVLALVSKLLDVSEHRGPDIVELKKKGNSAIFVTATKPSEKWELRLEIRQDGGHRGFAVRNEGAQVLHHMLKKKVRLKRIDLRNNQIDNEGAAQLLLGLRANPHVVQLTITDIAGHLPKDVRVVEKRMAKILSNVKPLKVTCLAAAVLLASRELLRVGPVDNTSAALLRNKEDLLLQTQQVINMRCLHHKGTIKPDLLQLDFGKNWPYYAALAFWDLEVLDIDFGSLFDTQREGTICFIQHLAVRCSLSGKYPKMPGALVAACRTVDCKTLDILLQMGCSPGETDGYGETPLLKLERRANFLKDKAKMLIRLHVCLKNLAPRCVQWGDVEWQLKNFALEMVRVCEAKDREAKKEVCLLGELCRNLRVDSRTSVADVLRSHVKTLERDAKQCTHMSKIPVERINTTLLSLDLFASDGRDLDVILKQDIQEKSRPTGRRQNPLHIEKIKQILQPSDKTNRLSEEPWIHRYQVSDRAKLLWGTFEAELGVPKLCLHGVYLFEFEYAEYKKQTGGTEDWEHCPAKETGPEETGRRKVPLYDGDSMTFAEFSGKLWDDCAREPAQIRRLNNQGFYVFKHDWAEEDIAVFGEWANGKEETPPPLNSTIRSVLLEPSQNLFSPDVYGGKTALDKSVKMLDKWAKTWAVLNSTLSFCEEHDELQLHRTQRDVPHLVVFHHMKLIKGQVFGLPETSMWEVEKRKCKSKKGKFLPYRYFESDKEWRTALRKWTEKGCRGIALDKDEFGMHLLFGEQADPEIQNLFTCTILTARATVVIQRDLQGIERDSIPEANWTPKYLHNEILNKWVHGSLFDLQEVLDTAWGEKDPFHEALRSAVLLAVACKDDFGCAMREAIRTVCDEGNLCNPFYEVLCQAIHEAWDKAEPESNWTEKTDEGTCSTIRFIARGKFRGAFITNFGSNKDHRKGDVLLPALETFFVEDVTMMGNVLTIRLIARGSMLNNDPELASWCREIGKRLINSAEEQLSESKPILSLQDPPSPSTRAAFRKTSVGPDAVLYFSAACESFSAGQRADLVEDIEKILAPVNKFGNHTNSSASGSSLWSHARVVAKDGQKALPITYRLSYTFLSMLGREPRGAAEDCPSAPPVEFGDLMEKPSSTVIEISAKTVEEVHDKENANMELDPVYDQLAEKPPPAAEVYGDGVFKITVGELQQLVRSTIVTTSASLPQKFYEHLVGRFTSHPKFMHFFTVFRTSPLIDIWGKWKACHIRHRQLAGEELEALKKAERRTSKEDHEGMYMHRMLQKAAERDLEFLKQGNLLTRLYQQPFSKWVQSVLETPATYGFTSHEHAVLTLNKTLMELSTEVCVSQKGHFFVSGSHSGKSNHIAEKPPRAVTFLSAPGLDFRTVQPTLKEANKYFQRIKKGDADESTCPHKGWSYFKEGKRKEFCLRVKELYRCIFTAARKQGVRNMCMLNLGLGAFLENIKPILKPEIVKEYCRAQFELLCEEDWGFENYFLNAAAFTTTASNILDRLQSHLKCNLIFHDKDVKFLAAHLAKLGLTSSFLNPSDSQAVMQGCMGMYWELGRSSSTYVGEEDWAATSTGVLSCFSISHRSIGLVRRGDDEEETQEDD